MDTTAITCLSPLDGRYHSKTKSLQPFLSEFGLIYYRIVIEIRWLTALSAEPKITEVAPLTDDEQAYLTAIIDNFTPEEALKVKAHEAITNHDVKAVEYYLKDRLASHTTLSGKSEFIHFACTSEDINNLAYGLMVKHALGDILKPQYAQINTLLKTLAHDNATVPMLSRTHGQTASPTTMGKEIANVSARVQSQLDQLSDLLPVGKINGAVGNFNAHHVAYPEVDWPTLAENFVSKDLALDWMPYTTQIEPHDRLAEISHNLMRLNTILLDLCRDMWSYISLGYFKLKVIATETGSSTMPHKVNPIDFENAEGNLGLANALLSHLAEKLPISRWQRDLTDSTVLRNIGAAYGYCLLALTSLEKGLGKVDVNHEAVAADLDNSWEVLGEAIQTVMRRYGLPQPYEQLKAYTRGQPMNQGSIKGFIESLDLPDTVKADLLDLTPSTYTGYAADLANKI